MVVHVSVIIPCYRDAATLARALDSVYSQTRRVDEVVVVNDCSPDTEAIEGVLQDFPDVVYVKNATNVGLAASRNAGVHIATGNIVSFLDADDELHPQKVEFQLEVFRPDIAVACQVRRVGIGYRQSEVSLYHKNFRVLTVIESHAIIRRNRLTGASIMISRDLLLRMGGYDETLRSCEDFDLWLRLLDAGVAAKNILLPLYLYRINESGLSRNYPNICYWELQALKNFFQRRGGVFLQSTGDGRIWAFWLVKHLLRFEKCLDEGLREATQKNILLLTAHPLLMFPLLLANKLRVFRLFVIFSQLRRHWSSQIGAQ